MCPPDRRARFPSSPKAAPGSQRSNLDQYVVWLETSTRCWERPDVTFLPSHSSHTSTMSSNTSVTFLHCLVTRRRRIARALWKVLLMFYCAYSHVFITFLYTYLYLHSTLSYFACIFTGAFHILHFQGTLLYRCSPSFSDALFLVLTIVGMCFISQYCFIFSAYYCTYVLKLLVFLYS